jgi:hypothetical protein
MWTDLGVLTPSIVVCAAFCAGVWYILRGELAPKRRDREDRRASDAIPSEATISVSADDVASATSGTVTSEHEDAGDPSSGSRSRS